MLESLAQPELIGLISAAGGTATAGYTLYKWITEAVLVRSRLRQNMEILKLAVDLELPDGNLRDQVQRDYSRLYGWPAVVPAAPPAASPAAYPPPAGATYAEAPAFGPPPQPAPAPSFRSAPPAPPRAAGPPRPSGAAGSDWLLSLALLLLVGPGLAYWGYSLAMGGSYWAFLPAAFGFFGVLGGMAGLGEAVAKAQTRSYGPAAGENAKQIANKFSGSFAGFGLAFASGWLAWYLSRHGFSLWSLLPGFFAVVWSISVFAVWFEKPKIRPSA